MIFSNVFFTSINDILININLATHHNQPAQPQIRRERETEREGQTLHTHTNTQR